MTEIDLTDGNLPVTRQELRELIAQLDARFAAVYGRVGQAATVGAEVEQRLARRQQALDRGLALAGQRLDRAGIDTLRSDLTAEVRQARQGLGRIVVTAWFTTTVVVAGLCMATLVLTL